MKTYQYFDKTTSNTSNFVLSRCPSKTGNWNKGVIISYGKSMILQLLYFTRMQFWLCNI